MGIKFEEDPTPVTMGDLHGDKIETESLTPTETETIFALLQKEFPAVEEIADKDGEA